MERKDEIVLLTDDEFKILIYQQQETIRILGIGYLLLFVVLFLTIDFRDSHLILWAWASIFGLYAILSCLINIDDKRRISKYFTDLFNRIESNTKDQ
jgi:hypothetical protein